MPEHRSDDRPATPSAGGEPAPRPATHHTDRPRDHHPADARSPEEYTEPPGSHRRGRKGPATDVGA